MKQYVLPSGTVICELPDDAQYWEVSEAIWAGYRRDVLFDLVAVNDTIVMVVCTAVIPPAPIGRPIMSGPPPPPGMPPSME